MLTSSSAVAKRPRDASCLSLASLQYVDREFCFRFNAAYTENWVRGCSRSLKMARFDRLYTTFCWSVNVNTALSCTVFLSYLTLNNIVTLKSVLEVTQDHSNRYHSIARMGFPIPLHSNYGRIFSRL